MSTEITDDLRQLAVGDRVQVFDVNGSRMGQPAGGWDGTVVKVGRKLITVQYKSVHNTKAFRLDGGSANDGYGHQHIKTVEQAAESLRRGGLLRQLREAGLEVRFGFTLSTETLEALAAAAALRPVGDGS